MASPMERLGKESLKSEQAKNDYYTLQNIADYILRGDYRRALQAAQELEKEIKRRSKK